MHIKPSYRQFSHQKLLLLLIVALKYQIENDSVKYYAYYQTDLAFCTSCFQTQRDICEEFFSKVESTDELSLLNLQKFLPVAAFGRRNINLLKLKNENTKIIAKHFAKANNLHKSAISSEELSKSFLSKERLDGLQFCPEKSLKRFISLFESTYDEITIYLYLIVNAQPLLMPYLESRGGFPIPATYATCGFSLFQQYAGKSLMYFYASDFYIKLKIAKQLLEAALKFTEGFSGFRIYITDLNADNIVYDAALNRLSFVDLDTVLIVDTQNVSQKTQIHKHQHIDCTDCFAYSPSDICQSEHSDLNIFSSCQFLQEDLKGDITKGFLYPTPLAYSNLTSKVNTCLHCPSSKCNNRFEAAVDLIKFIDLILLNK